VLCSYDTAVDPRVNREACERLGIRSLAIAPIHRDGEVVGAIEVFAANPGSFNPESLDRITQAAEQLSSLKKPPARAAASGQSVADNSSENRVRIVLPFSKPIADTGYDALTTSDRSLRARAASHPILALFFGRGPARQGRWLVAGLALAATLAFVPASWLISRSSAHTTRLSSPALPSAAGNDLSSSVDSTGMATAQGLVSEATAPVRILMAKALAGNTNAQASLGDHYAHGDGVMRDRVKAAAWYIVASSRGSQRATKSAVEISRDLQPFEIAQVRFNLGTMFRDGIGTSADLMTSYLWFSLANTAGDVRAPGAQRNLEQVMTPSQIAEGRRRTAQWLKSHRSRWASTKDMIASNRVK
jgi:hypothetical protein